MAKSGSFENLFKLIKSNILYLSFLFFFTFILSELACIYLISNSSSKKEKIFLQSSFKYAKNKQNYINKNLKYNRSITSMKANLSQEIINFRKDILNSIIPSSFLNLSKKDKYVLFCGGSTTEASQVKEGIRPVDIFSKNSKYMGINIAASGKGLNGCIDSFTSLKNDFVVNNLKIREPYAYVIATNINTLSDFLRDKYASSNKKKSRISFFGTNLYKLVSKFILKEKRNKLFGLRISNYEHAILDGCCFSPSNINNSNFLSKILSWEDPNLKKDYEVYLNRELKNLDSFAKSNDINKSKFIFFIEPNSLDIEYANLYRNYWKNVDGRQQLSDFDGRKIPNIEASRILNIFDNIYKDKISNIGFKVIDGRNIVFPKWSFYDSVHYTDFGAEVVGKYYSRFIN